MAVNVVTITDGHKTLRPLTKSEDMALRNSTANRRHHAMAMQGDNDGKRRQTQRNYNLLLLSGKIIKRFKNNISPDSRYVWYTYEPF